MDDQSELGEWEYKATAGVVRTLVPGEELFRFPAVRKAAEKAGAELQFDYFDDRKVLELLRLRRLDDNMMQRAGQRAGYPLALIPLGLAIYWGAYVQYWENSRNQTVFYTCAGAITFLLALNFAISAVRQWSNRARQKVRARAAAYRRIAHLAGESGAEIPAFYPHYGRYTFAARFHPDAEDLTFPETQGSA